MTLVAGEAVGATEALGHLLALGVAPRTVHAAVRPGLVFKIRPDDERPLAALGTYQFARSVLEVSRKTDMSAGEVVDEGVIDKVGRAAVGAAEAE